VGLVLVEDQIIAPAVARIGVEADARPRERAAPVIDPNLGRDLDITRAEWTIQNHLLRIGRARVGLHEHAWAQTPNPTAHLPTGVQAARLDVITDQGRGRRLPSRCRNADARPSP